MAPLFLPGKSHGQRNLAGYNPWVCKELDTTEQACTQVMKMGLHYWISALIKRDTRKHAYSLHTQMKKRLCAFTRNQPCSPPDQRILAPRTWENKFLMFKPSVCGILSWQSKLRQMHMHRHGIINITCRHTILIDYWYTHVRKWRNRLLHE